MIRFTTPRRRRAPGRERMSRAALQAACRFSLTPGGQAITARRVEQKRYTMREEADDAAPVAERRVLATAFRVLFRQEKVHLRISRRWHCCAYRVNFSPGICYHFSHILSILHHQLARRLAMPSLVSIGLSTATLVAGRAGLSAHTIDYFYTDEGARVTGQ